MSVATTPSEMIQTASELNVISRPKAPDTVSVRFGGGNPWALLDLDDGETMSVMAVQRADGEHGETEAQRLATLVALHSQTWPDT